MNDQILPIFERTGVLHTGHFKLTSGRHSDRYMQCGRVFEHAAASETLCKLLAAQFKDDGVTVVVGPALGAMLMAYEVSRHLDCRNMFAERQDGAMVLRRGFCLTPQDRVLVVEDTVTTGGTVREVLELCRTSGATLVGVGSFVDRSAGKVDFGVPYRALLSMDIQSWEEADCPLCKEGKPIVKPGSRQ